MRLTNLLLGSHIVALVFGLIGMLVMVPNPGLWAWHPILVSIFQQSMRHAGAAHIVLGAAAMFAFGCAVLGIRRTAIFLVASGALSLGCELLGTGTGWPFGAYEYTDGLGYKVLGRVPYSIPLSWFYMGLASYLLGSALVPRLGIVVGVGLLTVWDLVLDPAMAHESLPLRFWVWHQTGPYFGMPVVNFVGWFGTGLAFTSLSRWLWGSMPHIAGHQMRPPLAVYAVNVGFAMVLSASVGLWVPIALAATLGLVPVLFASRRGPVLGRFAPRPHGA
ncbi:MAG: carotenoid biosynthesis protein [Chloroflexota bacterium]